MQEEGVRQDQISQVRGFADQRLRLPENPMDSSNRRVTLVVQNPEQSGGEMAPMQVQNATGRVGIEVKLVFGLAGSVPAAFCVTARNSTKRAMSMRSASDS